MADNFDIIKNGGMDEDEYLCPNDTRSEMSKKTDFKIIWIDMEMTGLDPDNCHILEIACVVTNGNLENISNVFHVVVNQPAQILANMNDWCKEHHSKSGLILESKNSTISLREAEDKLLVFLKQHTPPGGCPIAGNTVYMDKLFISKHLPRVDNHLHYRVIDVTTITELCKRWYPTFMSMKKSQDHRAKTDLLESIAEMKMLRKTVFKTYFGY